MTTLHVRRVDSPPRFCACGAQLSPTSLAKTEACRSCSAKAREVKRREAAGPPGPKPTSQRPRQVGRAPEAPPRPPKPGPGVEMVSCGNGELFPSGNAIRRYNVYGGPDGCSLLGRVAKTAAGWQIEGRERGSWSTAEAAAAVLAEGC